MLNIVEFVRFVRERMHQAQHPEPGDPDLAALIAAPLAARRPGRRRWHGAPLQGRRALKGGVYPACAARLANAFSIAYAPGSLWPVRLSLLR